MRKVFLTLFIIFIISVIALMLYSLNKSNVINFSPTQIPEANQAVKNQNQIDLKIKDQDIKAVWIEVDDPQNISLIPNFSEKETAFSIIDKYGCSGLTNGGFYMQNKEGSLYSTQNFPIGLFITDNKKLGEFSQNSLFNGFFKITKDGTSSITASPQLDDYRIALQSGPILFSNGFPTKLNILDDKPERRVIVAKTSTQTYFIVFYTSSSVYLGPYLTDLPQLVKLFSQKKGIIISDALNLDGGSASTFHSNGFSLPELTPVGSFFCIR